MNPDFHNTALVISNAGMGQGDPALCQRLLSNYLKTLLELETAPQTILLYAAGVHMATQHAPARAELSRLAEAGSQIIICRTCLDHYGLMDQVPEAEIGNMLMIVEAQNAAAKVISL
jgi:sulfur relay (sulfurtransferase) complex TusBCD TusD component (DsrE family)